jgi:prepilin-type processing-associated H-X9-DG protein
MRSPVLTWTCVCVFAVGALGAQPLADRLPAGTLMYAGWAGTQTLQFDGSTFGQLLKDPAIGKAISAIQAAAEEDMSEPQQAVMRHAMKLGTIAWKRSCAVAWLDLQLGGQTPEPVATLLIDLGEQRDAFAAALNPLIDAIGKDLPVSGVTGGANPYRIARLGQGPELAFGYLDNVFFLTVGSQAPKRLFDVTPETSLQADARFQQRMQVVGGADEQIALYVDIAAVRLLLELPAAVAMASQGIPAPQVLLEALGVNKASCLAGSVRILDKNMYSRVRLFSPAPHRGLLMPLAGPALDAADLECVPADAVYFSAAKVSPAAVFQEIRRAIASISPQLDQQFGEALEALETQLGMSVSEDLLASLGDTWVLSSAPSHGGLLTGTLLSVNVRDTEAFASALEKIEQFAGALLQEHAQIETVSTGRTRIRYLAFPGKQIPFAPAWALHKGRFCIAPWPQVIQSAVLRGSAPNITTAPGFAPWRAHVAEKASVLSHIDLPAILRQTYHWPLFGWTMASNVLPGQSPLASRPAWLPPLARLEEYFSSQISAISADNEGITFERYGSLPFGAAFAGQGAGAPAVAVSILLPSLQRARQQARRTVSMANLNGIGKGAILHWAEHERMPAGLEELVPYLGSTRMFVSPISGRQPPVLVDGKLQGEVDYILLKIPNLHALKNPDQVLLAYERLENYGGQGTNAVYADGHVERLDRRRFREALDYTEAVLEGKDPSADF